MRIMHKIINQLKSLIDIENSRLSAISNTEENKQGKLLINLYI